MIRPSIDQSLAAALRAILVARFAQKNAPKIAYSTMEGFFPTYDAVGPRVNVLDLVIQRI